MSIIEKLGIDTPDMVNIVGDVWKIYDIAGLKRPSINHLDFNEALKLKKILDDKNELLMALIKRNLAEEKIFGIRFWDDIELIEKITGKSWEEIKQIEGS